MAPTRSVLKGGFEDYDDVSHVAKAQKLGRGEGETAKSSVSYSQIKKIVDWLMAATRKLCSLMEHLKTEISGLVD